MFLVKNKNVLKINLFKNNNKNIISNSLSSNYSNDLLKIPNYDNIINKSFYNLISYKFAKKSKNYKKEKVQDRGFEEYVKKEEITKELEIIEKEEIKKEKDEGLKCLVLHPIFLENKGAHIESYLAEEAIGLAKSLDWTIIKGPFWRKEDDVNDPLNWSENKEDESEIKPEKRSIYYKYRNKITTKRNTHSFKDGDYVYSGPIIRGVYYQGGVFAGGSETEDEDIYDEWSNLLLRESLALSSLVKMNKVKASTFFTKGRLNELGNYLRENQVDVIFINSTLSFVQKRNLEIHFNNYINEQNDRIRAYNIKSAMKIEGDATDTESNFSNVEVETNNTENRRAIKVLDRFNIIISIFAQRAKSKTSQFQVELAYLKYVRTRLARGGHVSYGSLYKDFGGDFLNQFNESEFEVVSAKQSVNKGALGGSGETQLELEKRKIFTRETQIKEILNDLKQRRQVEREARRDKSNIIPTIALVGYTNAGKTALMNRVAGTQLDSENKLFQTLTTTMKKINLQTKQAAILLDTIGFITDLPHELVESFKSTLEEIFYADVLIHVIDVSNPNHSHQKTCVYNVLDEIFPKDKNYKNRVIEVWNKIDLVNDINLVSGYISDNEFPVVPLSVKRNLNMDMFFVELINKINLNLGKEMKELRCKPEHYDKLYKWLKDSIGQPLDINYDEVANEMVMKISMDKNEFERYNENFVIMRDVKKRQSKNE